MGLKLAQTLAAVAIAASVAGAAWAVAVFRSQLGGRSLVWLIAPVLLSAAVFVAAGRRSLWSVWVPVGGALGFVVIGMWSVGIFFAPAALILVAAGACHVAHISAGRPSWGVALIPIWVLVGASGMCAVLLAYHQVQQFALGSEARVITSEAPFITKGTEVFVELVLLIGLASSIRSLLTRTGVLAGSDSGSQSVTSGSTEFVYRTTYLHEADMVAEAFERDGIAFSRAEDRPGGRFGMPAAAPVACLPGSWYLVVVPASHAARARALVGKLPVHSDS